jgi:hypothetical protein
VSPRVDIPVLTSDGLAQLAASNWAYARVIGVELGRFEDRLRDGEFQAWREIRHVLWLFGELGGMKPGDFTRMLLETVRRADILNRAKLANEFPTYVLLVEAMQLVPGTAARLRELVG